MTLVLSPYTEFPRSLDTYFIVTYYTEWVKTSWTYSLPMINFGPVQGRNLWVQQLRVQQGQQLLRHVLRWAPCSSGNHKCAKIKK